jgi:RNA polymerase sigma-70 factor, ECF subfamily
MHTTSTSLLERLRVPTSEEAWTRFVKLYTPLLFFWARRMGVPDQDAADLVQDVLLVLLQTLPDFTYDPRKSFRAWLRAITINKWRETRRKRGARSPTGNGELDDLSAPADDDAFWEVEYQRHLVGRALQLMQADFQPLTWKACWEFVVSGRPAAEVAADLGVSLDVVYSAKSRVLRRLREELGQLME